LAIYRKSAASHAPAKPSTGRSVFSSALAWLLLAIVIMVMAHIGGYDASTDAIVCLGVSAILARLDHR
jgi:hypothetical protein